jgi:hypothetical protein
MSKSREKVAIETAHPDSTVTLHGLDHVLDPPGEIIVVHLVLLQWDYEQSKFSLT